MTITVCHAGYRWVHDRNPTGSGQWGFHFGPAKDNPAVISPWFHSFGKAKQWAIKEARARGATSVSVAP